MVGTRFLKPALKAGFNLGRFIIVECLSRLERAHSTLFGADAQAVRKSRRRNGNDTQLSGMAILAEADSSIGIGEGERSTVASVVRERESNQVCKRLKANGGMLCLNSVLLVVNLLCYYHYTPACEAVSFLNSVLV